MQYSFKEIHSLNLLSDNPEYAKRFNTPPDLKVMTLGVIVILVTVMFCAIYFKVDKIVPAQGILETQAKLFQVRSSTSGFIDTIHIGEGERVSQGDVLITFDSERINLDIDQLTSQINGISRSIWTDYYQIQDWLSLDAHNKLNNSLRDVPNVIDNSDYQTYLVDSLPNRISLIDQNIVGLQAQQNSIISQLALGVESLELEQAEYKRLARLTAQGIESQNSVDAQKRSLLTLQSNQNSLASDLEDSGNEIKRLSLERKNIENDFVLERLIRLHDQLDQYHQILSRLASQQRERTDMSIKAPFSAIVDQVFARGKHEVIEAGSTLAVLRPTFNEDDLQIEIRIPSNYAIWVEPGMEFRASSLGNNPDDHGRIHGVVGFVSKSSEVIEGTRIYRMTGAITKLDTQSPETLLRPGLQLSVEIKAGERRLINYIFDPFTKYLRSALSEPS